MNTSQYVTVADSFHIPALRKDDTPAPAFKPLPPLAGSLSERKARTPLASRISVILYGASLEKRLAKKKVRSIH